MVLSRSTGTTIPFIITIGTFIVLAEHSRVQLIWVPGHKRIAGNDIAYSVAKQGSETPFIGPEPACSIPDGDGRGALWD